MLRIGVLIAKNGGKAAYASPFQGEVVRAAREIRSPSRSCAACFTCDSPAGAQSEARPGGKETVRLRGECAWWTLLLRNAGGLPDRVPADELVRHMLAEGRGRGALHHHAGRGQPLAHRGLRDDLVERLVEPGDDRGQRAARREHAVPGGDVVAGNNRSADKRMRNLGATSAL
jgi:hypothetical protein